MGFLVYVNLCLSIPGWFLPSVAAQLHLRTNGYSELPGKPLLFILDKNIQEVPQLFQHSYTGIGLRILQLHSLTSGRPDKIIFSSILNPGMSMLFHMLQTLRNELPHFS